METIQIAIYDDEHDRIVGTVDWLRVQPGCEVTFFNTAESLIRKIMQGYCPDLAIIDLKSEDNDDVAIHPEPITNVVNAFQEAAESTDGRLDISRFLDGDILADNGLFYWDVDRYFGIGLLALLRAAGVRRRVAHTQHDVVKVVATVQCENLANNGYCPKEEPIAKRRFEKMIAEIQEEKKSLSSRLVPDVYEVVAAEAEESKSWNITVTEKACRTNSIRFQLTGQRAVVFVTVAGGEGHLVTSSEIQASLHNAGYKRSQDKARVRGIIREIRTDVLAPLEAQGKFPPGFGGDSGLIHAVTTKGYALSGTLTYADDEE